MFNKNDLLIKELIVSKKQMGLFRAIETRKQGSALLALPRTIRIRIISHLKEQEILRLLHYLDPDDATDILQSTGNIRRKKIIEKLDNDLKDKVELLLKFNPKTAAGIMSLDYTQVSKGMTFREVFKLVKKHELRTGKNPALLAVDDGILIGEIPWRVLVGKKQNEKIDSHVRRVPTIKFDKNEHEVVKVFQNNPHNKIVVLDEDNSVLGVIYSDDVLRIIEQSAAENLYDFAGVKDEENIFDSAFSKVKHRYKWLILNLFTGFMAAMVVSLFQHTIEALVLLAVYMPIVAGMGGNAGTQTLAVIVRGLALKQIELKTSKKAILNEVTAGALNGLIIGGLAASAAWFINQSPLIGLAIGLSMIINLMIAGLFGSIVPLFMKSIHKDPATSATIFITTATDMCGFFVFLGIATILL